MTTADGHVAAALLDGLVDYAGLFPPAALTMADAVARLRAVASRARGVDARSLRAARRAARRVGTRRDAPCPTGAGAPWRLSALIGDRLAGLAAVAVQPHAHAGRALVDSVEVKAGARRRPESRSRPPPGLGVYVECRSATISPTAARDRRGGGRAKIRTGGSCPRPSRLPADVAAFIAGCVAARCRSRRRPGLHHPLRARAPLTYEPDCPRGGDVRVPERVRRGGLRPCGGRRRRRALLLEERRRRVPFRRPRLRGATCRRRVELGGDARATSPLVRLVLVRGAGRRPARPGVCLRSLEHRP